VFNRSVVEDALEPVTATPVAHYTRIGTLCHFMPPKAMGWISAWATPVQFLNDRLELSLGLEVLRDVANRPPMSAQKVRDLVEELLTTAGRLETDAFQMSFSGDPDELGQWRGYGSNGMGCCVVTDAVSVKRVADVAGWVIYNRKRQRAFAYKVLERLRGEKDDLVIQQVLVAAACYIKHEGFRAEQEFRLLRFPDPAEVRFRESGDRLVPYVDFLGGATILPVQRVVIGPGWQLAALPPAEQRRNHVVLGVDRLLKACGLGHLVPECSLIPYDPR
jgi:hypothetical protein